MVVLGQSFMLHQIRKMVGTAVAVYRGAAPADAICLALDPGRAVTTPMSPELGLFLDECIFESYNQRWGNDREARVRLGDFQEEVDAFKVLRTSSASHLCAFHVRSCPAWFVLSAI
jgi:tRNA pseudouridine38-40 synthase